MRLPTVSLAQDSQSVKVICVMAVTRGLFMNEYAIQTPR
jgi:hypothetical protein